MINGEKLAFENYKNLDLCCQTSKANIGTAAFPLIELWPTIFLLSELPATFRVARLSPKHNSIHVDKEWVYGWIYCISVHVFVNGWLYVT